MDAFLSLPASFAFVGFAFSFALSFSLAFAFNVKGVSTPRGSLSRHVPVLVQEILLNRGESALIERDVGAPSGNVRVELGPGLNGRQEVVDSCEFKDVVSATGEKLIVLSHGAAGVSEVCEQNKRGHDGGLSGVNFVFDDRTKHRFKFADEVVCEGRVIRCQSDA